MLMNDDDSPSMAICIYLNTYLLCYWFILCDSLYGFKYSTQAANNQEVVYAFIRSPSGLHPSAAHHAQATA